MVLPLFMLLGMELHFLFSKVSYQIMQSWKVRCETVLGKIVLIFLLLNMFYHNLVSLMGPDIH